jgi:hypothetical protein
VRFNLWGISADLPACRGCHVTHEQLAVIGVTVKVEYLPGRHPSWKTSVRFGRKFVKHHAGTSGGGTTFGGSGTTSGDNSCSGSC